MISLVFLALLAPSAPEPTPPLCLKDPAAERRRITCTPAGTRTPTTARGRIDPNEIYKTVAAKVDELLRCAELERAQVPAESLRVVVDLEINPDGSVRWACVRDAPSGEICVASCVLSEAQRMKFGAPVGGPVRVSYPFVLDRADD